MSESKMNESKNTGRMSAGMLIMLLLLLASIGGNIFQLFNTRQIVVEKEKTIMKIDSIATMKAKLELEFEAAKEELDQYKGRSQELDSLLAEANIKLEEQRKKIANLIDQNEGYDILRQRYAELDAIKNQYLVKIEELQAQNAELRAEVVSLQVKVDQGNEIRTELEGKVDIASRLKINSVVLKTYNIKASGKAVETEKANKAERLGIQFTVDDNPLAAAGKRTVYIRILNPEGFCLADQSATVRKFTSDSGAEITYSRNIEIEYAGEKLDKSFNFDKGSFTAGVYKVEIYIDGYFAGRGQVQLN